MQFVIVIQQDIIMPYLLPNSTQHTSKGIPYILRKSKKSSSFISGSNVLGGAMIRL